MCQVDDVAVYIKLSTISGENKNFISILKAIPLDEVKKKQKAISELAPHLQYSIVSMHSVVKRSLRSHVISCVATGPGKNLGGVRFQWR